MKKGGRYIANNMLDGPLEEENAVSEGAFMCTVREDYLQKRVSMVVLNETVLETTDPTIYSGLAGIGLMFWKAKAVVPAYAHRAGDYIMAAKIAVEQRSQSPDPVQDLTFLRGSAGVLSLVAVYEGEVKEVKDVFQAQAHQALQDLLSMGKTLHQQPTVHAPLGLVNGVAGYLYALLFVERHKPGSVPREAIMDVVDYLCSPKHQVAWAVPQSDTGKRLNFAEQGQVILGMGRGVAGVLTALLHVPQLPPETMELIRNTIDWILTFRLQSGNFPISDQDQRDELVQVCHGAAGMAMMLAKAASIFHDGRYLQEAEKCGAVVWERGILIKGRGLCHGIAGSAYAFLSLYRASGDARHFIRAQRFANIMEDDHVKASLHLPDNPYSLFEGDGGAVTLYADLMDPMRSWCP